MPDPYEPPTVDQLIELIESDGRLQIVPPGYYAFRDATAVLDVAPGNRPEPYWRALLRDDLGTAQRGDVTRFVATRLRQVALEGFPPRDFTEHDDGWWRISMMTDGSVGDYVPDDWA